MNLRASTRRCRRGSSCLDLFDNSSLIYRAVLKAIHSPKTQPSFGDPAGNPY